MTTQESSEAASLAAAAGSWLAPATGPTPALRGYPGGPGLPGAGLAEEGGTGLPAAGPAASPWQRSYQAWLAAGVAWLRQPGWLPEAAWPDPARYYWIAGPEQHKPAGVDWDHTEPIPVVRAEGPRVAQKGRAGKSRKPGGAGRPVPARPLAAAPQRAAAPPARPAAAARPGRKGWRPVAAAAAIALAAAAVVVTVAPHSPRRPARPAMLPSYPPARPADAVFGSGQAAGPGLLPSLATVAVSGSTAVAAGSQVGPPARRPVMLVSADGGSTWRLASLQAPGGDVTGGAAPFLLAGGPGGWLAVAGQAAWASATGQAWQREPGITLRPGDRVLGLARTAAGFLAVGTNTPPAAPGRAGGVLWTSADGVTWQRSTAARLGLRAAHRRVAALYQAAATGNSVVVTGGLAPAAGRAPGGTTVPALRAWRSGDGGATWLPVRLPAGHGGAGPVAGLAPDHAGFVLARAGHTPAGHADVVAYRSANGMSWQFAGVLTATGHSALQVTGVSGNSNGALVTATESGGRARGATVAFLTRTGRSWQQSGLLPDAAAGRLAGAAPGPGGVVIAAGSAQPAPAAGPAAGPAAPAAVAAPRPFLLLAGPHRGFVGQRALASAAASGVTVTALASAGGREVAVGSAGGVPVIWTARAGGHWAADPAGTWATPGLTLTGVTHGSGGWLTIGKTAGRGRSRLVLLTSRDAVSWQPVPGLRALIGKGTVITQAAAGPAGYVLVGEQLAVRRPAAVAWWSASPDAWTQAAGTAIPSRAPGRAARPASAMLAVTTGGPGFVAVGGSGRQPVAWSSQDGRSWTAAALPVPAGARSATLQRVAGQGQRIAAVGTELTAAGSLPFAAVSADGGQTWRESRLPLPACQPGTGTAGPAAAGVTAIVAAGGGFVATGTCGAPGRLDVVVWSSRDGHGWTAAIPHRPGLSGPGAQQITALTAGGGSLTGAGFTATLSGVHPTLWRLRLG